MPSKTKKKRSKRASQDIGGAPKDPIPPIPLGLPQPTHRESVRTDLQVVTLGVCRPSLFYRMKF